MGHWIKYLTSFCGTQKPKKLRKGPVKINLSIYNECTLIIALPYPFWYTYTYQGRPQGEGANNICTLCVVTIFLSFAPPPRQNPVFALDTYDTGSCLILPSTLRTCLWIMWDLLWPPLKYHLYKNHRGVIVYDKNAIRKDYLFKCSSCVE